MNEFQLAPGWSVKHIGDVCDILDNKRVPLSNEQRTLIKGEYPYYGANGLVDYIDRYVFDEDLILIAEDGGFFNDFITRPIAYQIFGPSWVNNHAHVLRAKDNYNQNYLFYSLEHKDILFFISGGTRQKLNQTELRNITINIPEHKNEQHKIAEILTTVDDTIEQTEVLIQKYQRIKQGLMQDLLTRGMDENGSLRPLRELSPNLYFKTAKGRLPKGWDVKTIKDISAYVGSGITPTGGSEVYSTEGILFIRSQNVTFEGLLLNDAAFISEKINKSMKRSEIFPNDVLLNITGASIGRCCVFPAGLGKANVNQHVCAIRLIKPTGYDADFLSLVLSSWIGQIQIDKLNAGGNRQGLNYEQLRLFQIPWPGEDERRRISEINQKNAGLIFAESNNLKNLCLIKKGLMQDLLTGKVRVNYE